MRIGSQLVFGKWLSVIRGCQEIISPQLDAPFVRLFPSSIPFLQFMKIRSLIGVVCLGITLAGRAQNGPLAQSTNVSGPQDTPYTIISRDENSRVWQRTVYAQDASGQWVTNLHSYTELASGICYQQNGQWLDSVEEIDPAPGGGAQALQAPHQAYFPYDIYSGVIQVVTPDGITLQSRPVGISFFDGTNSVLVAELTNSIGQIISPNQIIYTNAFTDIPADLLVTYRKSGLECDLVFRSQIPAPESFGLSSPATRLELLTEFFNTPDPAQTQATSLDGVNNVTLGFGQNMKMVRGRVFQTTGQPAGWFGMGIPVGKTWAHINGRTFLIEEVSYSQISPQLNALPALADTSAPSNSTDPALHKVSASRLLPLARTTRPATNAMKVAQADFRRKTGVVLDYVLASGNATNFTFRGDTTYKVSGTFNCYGITTFEGGTVIKYDTTAYASAIQTWNNIVCATAPYRPAIFTSCLDNSVGEFLGISNVPPYYDSVLSIDAGGEPVTMQNVRFCHTLWGLHPAYENFSLTNAQFIDCSNAFYPEYGTATINNILISGVSNAFGGINYTINGCQMTIANCLVLTTTHGTPSASSVALTNSLLYNVATNGSVSVSTGHTQIPSSSDFQSAGAGNYYLATNSTCHGAGTTNIDPNLLAALQEKTTYPPIVYTNGISTNLALGPQAPPDTNTTGPDLGYHYDRIDYLVDNFGVTNATLIVTNGAVLAGYNDLDVWISDGSSIVSIGSPLTPNWFMRYSCVQEQPLALGSRLPSSAAMIVPWPATSEVAGTFRFTKFSCPAAGGYHLYDDTENMSFSNLLVQDCEFWSGTNDFSGYSNTIAVLKNNLFARSGIGATGSNSPNSSLVLSNNLFWHTTTIIWPFANSNTWYCFNNSFDTTTIQTNSATQLIVNGYNAYLTSTNRLYPTNGTDAMSTNAFLYQPGALGTFYQPTNSMLIYRGSCTAGAAGLYHYTTTTNQTPDTTNTVTIGYHYVALGTNGLPLDSNGDGVPDYLEDANGDGLVDDGESNWALAILTQPQDVIAVAGDSATFSVVAGGIAPISYQWSFNGTVIAGETSSNLTLLAVTTNDAGSYSVVVADNFGSITSTPAGLIVNPVIRFTNFCDASSLKLNGNATLTNTSDGCVLELTPATYNQGGSAFSMLPIVLYSNASFSTFFSFRLSNSGGPPNTNSDGHNGADGIVFVLQTLTNNVPGTGGGIGYEGISNSVGVEFDTWYNSESYIDDPILTNGLGDGNHVGIDTNGCLHSIVTQHITDDMNNSNIWYAWVDYNGASMEVRLSETNSRPAVPVLTNSMSILNYLGTNRAYVGFTAGTGGDYNQQDILSWEFISPYNPIGVDTGPTVQLVSPSNQVLNADAPVTVQATATPFSNSVPVQYVEFLVGTNGGSITNIIGAAVTPTNRYYEISWTPPIPGSFVLEAEAVDSLDVTGFSALVTNTVRGVPVVEIMSPTNNQVFVPPSSTNITISATATASGGASITNLIYYQGVTPIGTNLAGPFSISWNPMTNGIYTLNASATDSNGLVGYSSNITVTVELTNQPLSVSMPPNQTNYLSTNPVPLVAYVSDDELRVGTLSVNWTNLTGGGNVTLSNSTLPVAAATFTATGTYVLQLTARDSQYTNTNSMTMTILPANQPPNVIAGTNQTLILPAAPPTNAAPTINLTQLLDSTGGFFSVGGFDYFLPSNCILASVDSPSSHTNFALVFANGTLTYFTSVSNIFPSSSVDEVYLTAARNTNGGFKPGEIFSGNSADGQIMRIEPDGTTLGTNIWTDGQGYVQSNAWVSLTNVPGAPIPAGVLQGGLCLDQTGVWGGDLIVSTMIPLAGGGYLWRVNSQGKATLITALNDTYPNEGVTTIPNDPQKYGPWAGRIILGGDNTDSPISAVDTNGVVTTFNFDIGGEDFRVIPPGENFYALAGPTESCVLYSAPASDFQGMVGDIIVADENPWRTPSGGLLYRLHWNGNYFEIYPLSPIVNEWEHVGFAPAGFFSMPPSAVQLAGAVTDDGELFAPTSNHWAAVSNAASVQFLDAGLTNTIVEFATPGTYTLQLSAYDGQYTVSSNVTISVLQNQAPTVNAGANQTITNTSTTLQGTVTDDGLPYHITNCFWSVVSSNGVVSFSSLSITNPSVTFGSAGMYVLMLEGDDEWSTNYSQVTINVQGPSLSLTPTNTPVTETNGTVTITASVLDLNGNGVSGDTVNFLIANGPDISLTLPSKLTDSHGFASVTYTNTTGNPGEDLVEITVGPNNLSNVVYEDWGTGLGCGDSLPRETVGSDHSMEFPTHLCDYYFIAGQSGETLNLSLTQNDAPLVMFLRDLTSNTIVAESAIQLADTNTVVPITYTCTDTGNYLVEIMELLDEPNDDYALQLSCGGGPVMDVLTNGNVVPNSGTVVFPPTAQGLPTNVLLAITNEGNASFSIIGFGTNGDFVLTNNVLGDTIAAGAQTNLGVKFNATSNGVSFGALELVSSGGLNTDYIVYFMGTTFPTNEVPTVQWNYPTNGSVFLDTESINFSTTVTAGSAEVTNVQLFALGTNGIQALGENPAPLVFDSDDSYTNSFLASLIGPNQYAPDGDFTLVAVASDVSGQTNISAPLLIHIVGPQTTNVAVTPELEVFANQATATNGGTIVFPNTTPGYPTNITLVISNAGNYPLAITNFVLNGDFAVSSDVVSNLVNETIAAGAATILTITFNASSSGTSVGEIAMEDNVENSGVYSTYLMGNAYPPGQGLPSNSIPPVATNEVFHVPANSQNNILMPLAQDSDANGYALTIVSAFGSDGGTVGVIGNGAAISYTPPRWIRSYPGMPADGFTYVISDGHGGTASGTISIIIDASDIPEPIITFPPPDYSTNAGSVVPLTVEVTNSPNVTEVDFYVGPVEIAVVTNGLGGQWTTNWTALADDADATVADEIQAVAKDKFGQIGVSGVLDMTVTLPPNAGQDIAALDSFVDASGSTSLSATNLNLIRDGLLNLYGQATNSQGSNVVWQLGIYGMDGTLIRNLTPLMSGAVGTTNSPALLLSNCDLTTLQNGVYDLTLTVTGGDEMNQATVQIQLESNLKIGQFSFSQQDLVIPVNGVPLTVTRTYNSLNPDQGDFGKGWTYALADLDVQFDEERQDVVDLSGRTFSERVGGGRDVTLTLPNGQRTTFYFTLQQGGIGPGSYQAVWQSAPGVTATLTPMGKTGLETFIGGVVADPSLYYWDATTMGYPMDAYDFPGYTLTTLDGTAYVIKRDDLGSHYLDNGGNGPPIQAFGAAHLYQIITRNNAVTTIGLNSIVTTSPTGATNQITFQRNAAGLITSISDPISIASNGPPAMNYQYDTLNNLIAVERLVDRSGSGTYVTNSTFSYTNVNFPHYVTGIINADGTAVAENFYDDSGKLTNVLDANGNATYFIHNPTNDMEVIVDRNDNTNTYVYDPRGNVTAQTNQLGQITTMAYDANNNETNKVMYLNGAPYSTNTYVYDTNNLLLISIDPLEHGATNTYDDYGDLKSTSDPLGHTTINTYDSDGNLTNTIDALGDTNLKSYGGGLLLGSVDAVGTLTTNAYDSNDNLIGMATIDSSGVVSSNSFTYDENNNQVTSTIWRRVRGVWTAATTTNVYDAENRVIQTLSPDGGTNFTYYNVDGTQQATVDALGRMSSFIYDGQLRLKEADYPDGTAIQFDYDNSGNRTRSIDQTNRVTIYYYDPLNRVTNTVYADQTTTATIYDGVGRVAQSIDARGTITAYDYDAAGRQLAVTNAFGTSVQMVSQYIYDADGNEIVFIDPTNRCTTNVYDALNRQVQTQFADGTTNSTGFDAESRKVAQTNQDGIVNLFGYDGEGRLISVTNALSKPEQMVTQYQYDEAANEVAQVDALDRTNVFVYDGMGRRVAHSRPDGQTELFAYDTVGNLLCQTNFDGDIITNQYDIMNRLTGRGQAGIGPLSSYAYTPTGRRSGVTNFGGGFNQFDLSYEYDSRDRLMRKTTTWNGGTSIEAGSLVVSLNYGYDVNGNLTNMASSMANGVNLAYSYDPLNRMVNVLSHGQLAASYTFDAVGNLQGMKYGNGLTNAYQYDSLNRLTNLVWMSNSATVAKFYYQLGKTGNRTNLSEIVNGIARTNTWQYDNLYRLTSEIISGMGNIGYQFDPVGNRTNRASTIGALPATSYQYNTNDWLATDGYDNLPGGDSNPSNGNTTTSGTNSYGYNVLNQMLNANYPAIQMAYDPDGNRYVKTADGGNTWTLYLVDDRNPTGYPQVVEEYQGSGSTSSVYLKRAYNYGMSLISQQQYDTNTLLPSILSYYGMDGHGSVRFLTDTNQHITDTYVYDAYGTLISSNGSTPNNYLYTGQQFDPDLGLYYLRARYYNTDTGRFWTSDIFGGHQEDPLSLHKYVYCEADPIENTDPTGHDEDGSDGTHDVASGVDAEIAGDLPINQAATAALKIKTLYIQAYMLFYSKCTAGEVNAYVDAVNDTLKKAGIKVQLLGAPTAWDMDKTMHMTDGDFAVDQDYRDSTGKEQPGDNWKNVTADQNNKHANVYFSDWFFQDTTHPTKVYPKGGVGGMTAVKGFGSPPYPACFIVNQTYPPVPRGHLLAHEFGHLLGLIHAEDAGLLNASLNLMSKSEKYGTDITLNQVNLMRTSTLLK